MTERALWTAGSLPPATLKQLYEEAIEPFLNRAAYEAVVEREKAERMAIKRFRFRDEFEAVL